MFRPPNLAVELIAEGIVEVLAVAAGLALVLVSAADAASTLVTTRRRPSPRGLPRPYGSLSLLGLLVFWVLLLVPLQFRHHTARLDITRSG